MGDRGQASEWETTLDDLDERRTAARAMGGEERLAKHRGAGQARRARPHRPPPRSPGPSRSSARSSVGRTSPADAIVMGSGRIDGRPVMVAAEDFTVKAGTISQAANSKR